MSLEDLDDTAMQILNAASERFLHYGFKKTTMSEIASDCNMSTGNLYRYFASKMDIAETFVRVLREELSAVLHAIASNDSLKASEKLKEHFRKKFQVAYDRFHNNPKAYELSLELISERPKFAIEWETHEQAVLAGTLAEGEMAGEFALGGDPMRSARILQDATFRFTGPGVIHEGEFEQLSEELEGVLMLILDAFYYRKKHNIANK